MSRFRRWRGTKSDLWRGRLSRRWWLVVAIALALAFGSAPAQAAPFVYVTGSSGPSSTSVGEIFQFDVGVGGLLEPLSPSTVATGENFAGALAASPDGRSVYVSGENLYVSDYFDRFFGDLSQYDVGADGTLSPKNPPAFRVDASHLPGAIAVSPDGQSVYVSAGSFPPGGPPGNVGEVFQYDVGAGGALSLKSPPTVATGYAPAGLVVSPDGKSVYVANFFSNNLSQYDVGAGGALSPKSPATVAVGANPSNVAVSPPRVPTRARSSARGAAGATSPSSETRAAALASSRSTGNQLR